MEGFGLGDAPPLMAEALLEALAGGVAVVVATRCHGGAARAVYGGAGGGHGLAGAGALFAGALPGVKARLLLALLLEAGAAREELARVFALL